MVVITAVIMVVVGCRFGVNVHRNAFREDTIDGKGRRSTRRSRCDRFGCCRRHKGRWARHLRRLTSCIMGLWMMLVKDGGDGGSREPLTRFGEGAGEHATKVTAVCDENDAVTGELPPLAVDIDVAEVFLLAQFVEDGVGDAQSGERSSESLNAS